MPIPLFDAHCDTIDALIKNGGTLFENTCHLDLTRSAAFRPYAQVFAVWGRPRGVSTHGMGYDVPDFPESDLTAIGNNVLGLLLDEFAANSDSVKLCLCAGDARTAAEENKTAAFISIEGAELIGCSMDSMWSAFERGVRIVNITWNYDNKLSGSAMGSGDGLSEYGEDFVHFLQAIGVAVDVSHISERAFWDICDISRRPFIASHSSSRALFDHPRNLTDTQFCAIRDAGGAVGVNFYPKFIGGTRDIDAIVLHIEHFLSLGGKKAVCLGGDLDGIDNLPSNFRDVRDYSLIFDALLRRGYPEQLVCDIFYNNILEVLEKAL